MNCCNCSQELLILNQEIIPDETIIVCSLCSTRNAFDKEFKPYEKNTITVQVTNPDISKTVPFVPFDDDVKPLDYKGAGINQVTSKKKYTDFLKAYGIDAGTIYDNFDNGDGDDKSVAPVVTPQACSFTITNKTDERQKIEFLSSKDVFGVDSVFCEIEPDNQYEELKKYLQNNAIVIKSIRVEAEPDQMKIPVVIQDQDANGAVKQDVYNFDAYVSNFQQQQNISQVDKEIRFNANSSLATDLLPNSKISILIFYVPAPKISDAMKTVLGVGIGLIAGFAATKLLSKYVNTDNGAVLTSRKTTEREQRAARKQAKIEARNKRKEEKRALALSRKLRQDADSSDPVNPLPDMSDYGNMSDFDDVDGYSIEPDDDSNQ